MLRLARPRDSKGSYSLGREAMSPAVSHLERFWAPPLRHSSVPSGHFRRVMEVRGSDSRCRHCVLEPFVTGDGVRQPEGWLPLWCAIQSGPRRDRGVHEASGEIRRAESGGAMMVERFGRLRRWLSYRAGTAGLEAAPEWLRVAALMPYLVRTRSGARRRRVRSEGDRHCGSDLTRLAPQHLPVE